MAAHKTFSNEQANFILQNYRGKTNTEICDLLNQKFCTNFRPKQVEHFKYTNHLYSLKKKFHQKSVVISQKIIMENSTRN